MRSLKEPLRVPDRMGWNGDPCAPTIWDAWEGVTCHPNKDETAFVISQIDLGSQGLKGYISDQISLFDKLEKPALDWNTRKINAIGAARGLLYLHEQCDPKIIHRDVNAANILLDDYYEAVVGDFGLTKLLDHADFHVTTAVRGTIGHIAPEYLSTG